MLHRSNGIGLPNCLRRPASQSERVRASIIALLLFLALVSIGVTGMVVSSSHAPRAHASGGTPGKIPVGLNVDFNEQSFVDLMHEQARLQAVPNGTLTQDANGDPSSDFAYVLDNRYYLAWVSGATNIDPLKYATDLSGTYTLTFNGKATLTATGDDPAHMATTISNQSYDASTNTTTASVTFGNPSGGLLSIINFTNTQRDANAAVGTGLTNLHLWRPGYAPGTSQVFTNEWLSQINDHPWSALRFMGALGTNSYAGYTTAEVYPYRLNWSTDRLQPGKGVLYGNNHVGVHGEVSWEDVVLVAQATHKDIWINIPVNASDDYVTQLANLLKNGNQYTNNQGIPADVTVYVEYSNEMWHYGFYQGSWNYTAAGDEVKAGGSNLSYDGSTSQDTWRFRRFAKRTIEIGNTFKSTFNDNGARIRPVVNNANVGANIDILTYVSKEYGTPSQYLYGMAQTTYYQSTDRSSVQSILSTMQSNSDSNVNGYIQGRAIATYFGVHQLVYEGGEGDTNQHIDGSSETDQEYFNQFAATRDPGMQQVEMHDMNNWFSSGGELYMQFSQVTRYGTYGFWGLSDDLKNQSSGKWKGYIQAMNTDLPSVTNAIALPGTSGQSITIPEGAAFVQANASYPWHIFLVNASQTGTYSLTLQGSQQNSNGQERVTVDNQQAGTTSVSSTTDSTSTPITFTLSTPGLHTIFVYQAGPDGLNVSASDVFTITLTATSGLTSGSTYAFVNQTANKCLDNEASTSNGTGIWIWDCDPNNTNQAWTLNRAGNGSYELVNKTSGKCLDDTNGSAVNGTKLQEWDCVGNQNQLWNITSLGNGYYQIANVGTGKCVDDSGWGTNDGNPTQLWDCVGNSNQAWSASPR